MNNVSQKQYVLKTIYFKHKSVLPFNVSIVFTEIKETGSLITDYILALKILTLIFDNLMTINGIALGL